MKVEASPLDQDKDSQARALGINIIIVFGKVFNPGSCNPGSRGAEVGALEVGVGLRHKRSCVMLVRVWSPRAPAGCWSRRLDSPVVVACDLTYEFYNAAPNLDVLQLHECFRKCKSIDSGQECRYEFRH